MPKLTSEEARSLATVFGETKDVRDLFLLLCFQERQTKYDVLKQITPRLSKSFRIPRASLYRKISTLYDSGFLRIQGSRKFKGGNPTGDTLYYGLSAKGTIAAGVYSYVLYYDPKIPRHERRIVEQSIRKFESLPACPTIIESVRWHKKTGVDLSRAKFNYMYLVLTGVLPKFEQAFDNPEYDDPATLEQVVELKKMIKSLLGAK